MDEKLRELRCYRKFLNTVSPEEWVLGEYKRFKLAEQKEAGSGGSAAAAADGGHAAASEAGRPPRTRSLRNMVNAIARVKQNSRTKLVDRRASSGTHDGKAVSAAAAEASASALAPPPPLSLSRASELRDALDKVGKVYFSSPQEFLSILAEMEDRNLSLFKDLQDAEENWEAVRERMRERAPHFESQVQALKDSASRLNRTLQLEQERVARMHVGDLVRGSAAGEKQELHDVTRSVRALYDKLSAQQEGLAAQQERQDAERRKEGTADLSKTTAIGGTTARASPSSKEPHHPSSSPAARHHAFFMTDAISKDPITLLHEMETLLESLLTSCEQLPAEFVEKQMRECVLQRRADVREVKRAAEQKAHEERVRRIIERAQAPVVKKVCDASFFLYCLSFCPSIVSLPIIADTPWKRPWFLPVHRCPEKSWRVRRRPRPVRSHRRRRSVQRTTLGRRPQRRQGQQGPPKT